MTIILDSFIRMMDQFSFRIQPVFMAIFKASIVLPSGGSADIELKAMLKRTYGEATFYVERFSQCLILNFKEALKSWDFKTGCF